MAHAPINPAGKCCCIAVTPAVNTFRAGPTRRSVTFTHRRSRLLVPSKPEMRGPDCAPQPGLSASPTAVSLCGNSASKPSARVSNLLFPPEDQATLEGDDVYTRVHHNTPASESEGWTGWFRDRATGWWGPTVVGLRRESLFTSLILAVWLWARKVKGSQQGPRRRKRYERPLPLHPDTPELPWDRYRSPWPMGTAAAQDGLPYNPASPGRSQHHRSY